MLTIKVNIDGGDKDKILEQLMFAVALDFEKWFASKSLSPARFYKGLSTTVFPEGNKVYGSGLAKWILDHRPYLLEEYMQDMGNRLKNIDFSITQ